jgi:hypothetical protein
MKRWCSICGADAAGWTVHVALPGQVGLAWLGLAWQVDTVGCKQVLKLQVQQLFNHAEQAGQLSCFGAHAVCMFA